MQAPPHSRDLRKGRFSQRGQIYLVTSRCSSGRPFADLRLGGMVVDEILASDRAGNSHTLAFVVMPNHLHWLLELRGEESLSRVVGRMKGRAAHRINRLVAAGPPVWQSGFHDRALRSDANLISVARYLLDNPVRAGLVRNFTDYPLLYVASRIAAEAAPTSQD